MFTIDRTRMAAYYQIKDRRILKLVVQLWHQMLLQEGIELGYSSDNKNEQQPTVLPFLYCTAAAAELHADLIDRLDLMTDQAINGNQQ